MAVQITVLLPVGAVAQSSDTEDEPPRSFGLGLVARGSDQQSRAQNLALDLDLSLVDEVDLPHTAAAGDESLAFDLEVSSAPSEDSVLSIDFGLDFDDGSWFFAGRRPLDPLERHVAAEAAAVIPGGRGRGLLLKLDSLELVSRVREWRRARRERRLPPGARVARNRELELIVRGDGISEPKHLTVVTLTDGWVGETIHTACEDGRCRVEGLPAAGSTLLVRGDGAALMPWNPADRELFANLRPSGTVRLEMDRESGCESGPIRVVAVRSGLAVPLAGWRSPGLGEWVDLETGGRVAVLPAGNYRIEQAQGGSQGFEVVAGTNETVAVAPCRGGQRSD